MSKYTEAQVVLFDIYKNVLDFKDEITSKAFENADKALKVADRLEQADVEEMAIRIVCSKCRHTMCRRNPKYEGEQDLFEVECDLFRRFRNDAILVLADIRGDTDEGTNGG